MAGSDALNETRRRALGDAGRPVPDRAAVRDVGDRRHDPDQRVRAAARARAVRVAGGGDARRSTRPATLVRSSRRWRSGSSQKKAGAATEGIEGDRGGAEVRTGRRRAVRTAATCPNRPGSATSDRATDGRPRTLIDDARRSRDVEPIQAEAVARGRDRARTASRRARLAHRATDPGRHCHDQRIAAAVAAAIKAVISGEDADLGVSWQLVDGRGRRDRRRSRPGD